MAKIQIQLKSNSINFWNFANISKSNKIPHGIIFKQALKQKVLTDDNFKLLEKFIDFLIKNERNYQSQLYQDTFAAFVIHNNYNKTFLEFGAADGIDLSNSYTLEKDFLWSGALGEPDPQWENILKKNRPKSKIINKCIWSVSDKKIKFFSSKKPLLSTIDDFKFSDLKSMPDNSEDRNREGKNLEVETVSLNHVIEREFDDVCPSYISIDTEGSELDILQSFNFEKYNPVVFTIEHNYTEKERYIDELLEKNNYVRVFKKLTLFDAWYISREALTKLTSY